MSESVASVNGVNIRLTDERWIHITEEQRTGGNALEVLETIANPTRIYKGAVEEFLAAREIEEGKFLVVIYRETESDGFIITAFLTRRIKSLEKKELVWSQPN